MFARFAIFMPIVWLLAMCPALPAEDVVPRSADDVGTPSAHGDWIPLPTLGGKQFWSDELFFRGWRIQRHAVTEHHRLLDPDDRRHGWGGPSAILAVSGLL